MERPPDQGMLQPTTRSSEAQPSRILLEECHDSPLRLEAIHSVCQAMYDWMSPLTIAVVANWCLVICESIE
jgi:hypothetical protein